MSCYISKKSGDFMIRRVNNSDIEFLKNSLFKDKFQNPYFYIDIHSFGYKSGSVATYILETEDCPQCYIYAYFDTVQIYVLSDVAVNIDELSDFILKQQFKMVSGNSNIISLLSDKLTDVYSSDYGVIMKYKKISGIIDNTDVEWASENQCREIAELICSDSKIGGHYDIHNFELQLIERMNFYNCRNVIILDNEKIVSHAATYADEAGVAIIGGVITDSIYRGRGFGKKCVLKLAEQLLKENKTALLYCYDDTTIAWYSKMGWNVINKCGKLERLK